MKDKKIGQIILKGGSILEIQKEFPDFPENPTKEYFMEKGYKESTAKRYIYLLKKNAQKTNLEKNNTEKADDTLSTDKEIQFIASKNANYENLLVDTCALCNSETLELIEQASNVTFIYATIEEMDQKKNHPKLRHNIQLYSEKILLNPQKYMLSRFSGCFNDKYPDNILLQYMLILPEKIRPTLITANKNLSLKAEALNLQYILFLSRTVKTNDAGEKVKKLGYGIKLISNKEGNMYIEYKGTWPLFITRESEEISFCGTRQPVLSGDSLLLKQKFKEKVIEHHFKI